MTGAQKARVTGSRNFDLADMRVVVAVVDGTVQLLWLADGWTCLPRKVISNTFCDRATPGQLRALADHLDGLALSAPVEVR